MVVGGSSGASTLGATKRYVYVQPELLIVYEPCDWLIDAGANVHVGADKSLFVSYQAISGRIVSMGSSSTAEVLRIGSVDLKFPSRKKLGPKTVDVVFLGYVETSYTLRFLVIISEIPGIEINTIVEFRDVIFLEDIFSMKTRIPSSVSLDDSLPSMSIPEHVEKMTNMGVNPNSSTSLTHEESDEPRRSKIARFVKDFGSDFVTYISRMIQ
ncbi:UNVERIFIED_CONTAM: hypothetical protein Scaly_0079200 [Sesamum calycinum]|uniref:Retrovirus-related Pol polyprotein from transposon TNT 1-94-like beta-barrel domain-containing protein n=1 Tax=Sesamum calycinum TaxID=2727403 RepID=A0AAW2SV29_9LAMI